MVAADSPGVIAPPPLIAAVVVVFGLLLDWIAPAYVLTVLFAFDTRVVIGIVLFGIGATLAVKAVREFRAANTYVEPWKPTLALVTTGIFKWVRNPIYVGGMFMLAGLAFALASDWMLVLLAAAFLLLHRGVVLREERYLGAKFGDAYLAYRRDVPRYGWPRLSDLRRRS